MRKFHFEKSRLNQILIDGKLTMKKLALSVELSFGDLLSSESQCIRKVDIENIRFQPMTLDVSSNSAK